MGIPSGLLSFGLLAFGMKTRRMGAGDVLKNAQLPPSAFAGAASDGQAHPRQGFSSPCCLAIPAVLPGILLNKNEAVAVAAREHA